MKAPTGAAVKVVLITALCLMSLGGPLSGVSPSQTRDPLFKKQWGLRMIGAPRAWPISTGAGVTVAVLDTGVDVGHPDLKAGVAPGGRDLVDGDRDPVDEDGHGTHVAGIILARRNGSGIVGVAPEARLLTIRVCDDSCQANVVARGIRVATDEQADIINLSLSSSLISETNGDLGLLRKALDYARRQGVIVVAAAGNSLLPICNEPAASAVCVGALTRAEQKAAYSNSDATMQEHYLVAPGGDELPTCDALILSTFPRHLASACGPRGYDAIGGTSMAAPHVAGAAALLLSAGFEPDEVIDRLLSTTHDLGLPGRDPIFGFGLLDVASALSK